MILMIYNNRMCREVLLPNLHDADYREIIPAEAYGLSHPLSLLLEVTDEGWFLRSDGSYRLIADSSETACRRIAGGDIMTVVTQDGEKLRVIAADAAFSFLVTEKFDLTGMQRVTIGKNEGSMIRYDFRELISGLHALLERRPDGWYLTDLSTNGVFTQEGRVRGSRRLSFAEHLNLFGLHLISLGEVLAVGTYYGSLAIDRGALVSTPEAPPLAVSDAPSDEIFNRSPRDIPSLYTQEIEISAPPAMKEQDRRPWMLVVGPSLTMAIPMVLGCLLMIYGMQQQGSVTSVLMFTGLVTAVGSAVIGAYWAAKNLKYARGESQEEEEKRFNAYSNYLIEVTQRLESQYLYNTQALRRMYPPAAECVCYGRETKQLWNRNPSHDDFLFHRLGIGEEPFQVRIRIPQEQFSMDEDSLPQKPRMIREQFRTLEKVPVGIPLTRHHLIGLIGGPHLQGAVSLMHAIVADIAASHCYTDVKFVFLYDEADSALAQDFMCLRYFPHVWSEDRQIRYLAADEVERRDVLYALSGVLRERAQEEETHTAVPKPYYLLFCSDPKLLEGEILTRLIYDPKPSYGITTFLMARSVEQLPNACGLIIENDAFFRGFYEPHEGRSGRRPVVFDEVSTYAIDQMGRRLCQIRVQENEITSQIPQSLDFFEMYGVRTLEEFHVEERWKKNRTYNSMRALIGVRAGGAACYLDVHEKYHGPHGLVAGTTGSGKSEMLQTYILSLALNFSPEDVAFFIIDFKGGGMANLFSSLPHLAGQISNLSGNQIRRAMISIKSENRRRQQIFTAHGVNNINLYTRLYKEGEADEPIPHLFLIIDEFAELKKEEPDFMRELISVAQVGRSLGVHLILATQKPGGTVDDNIWSNSRFRICLRVQDRQDSRDMLHRPDAAFLTQTGRGYLQVGNDEIYELFQTGWSGAPYEDDGLVREASAVMLTRTGRESLAASRLRRLRLEQRASSAGEKPADAARQECTQLSALVEYLGLTARRMGCGRARGLWLEPLGARIFLEDLPRSGAVGAAGWSLRACVGLADDPEYQRRLPLEADFAQDGNLAVCGGAGSGKSTFLQTLLCGLMETYTPAQLQCYLVDFSTRLLSPFEKAPHTGGIVYENQEDHLDKCMHLMERLLARRREALRGGSYDQYVQAYGQKLPAILLVIDNFTSFREKTAMKYDDLIMRYAREGSGYGMYLAVSASGFGISDIPMRIADHLRTAVSLEQSDHYKYMDILRRTRIGIEPEAGVRGRGLAVCGGRVLEFQTALCLKAQDDYARGVALEALCEKWAAAWTGVLPQMIPRIPEHATIDDLSSLEDYGCLTRAGDVVPFAYAADTADVFGVGLRETYCYTIAGRAHTGKTNVLRLLMHGAYACGGQLCVIEPAGGELRAAAGTYGADYRSDLDGIFDYFQTLTPEFVRRNRKKNLLRQQGASEDEIYLKMHDEECVFIFLSDLGDFFRLVYEAEQIPGRQMAGFMQNILEKGSLHRIYFFGCLKSDEMALLSAYPAYQTFVSYKKGVYLGGYLSEQHLFSFQNIPYQETLKSMRRGLALAADEEDETAAIRIAVPLWESTQQ